MNTYILIAQITVAILLSIAILFQQRGSTALGSAFGGGDSSGGGAYASRRGFQKKLYWASIVLGIIFILLAVVNLLL